MSSLFKDISGGRPEHVAKGALIYLLRNDPSLVAWLAQKCDRSVPSDTRVSVMAEVAEGESGWRADVVLEWAEAAKKPLALELKLGAPFTPNQKAALLAGEIDVVIAPTPNLASVPPGTRVVTWREVLSHVTTTAPGMSAAVLLLNEAAESYGWYLERITAEDINADAAAMFDGDKGSREQRDWSQSYRFLSQLDVILEESVPAGWRYSSATTNLRPNKKYAHYGYYFALAPKGTNASVEQWWIGFNRENGVLAFRLYMNENEIKHEWSINEGLQATVIAAQASARIQEIVTSA